MLTSNELVLTFGSCYLCATFGENRSRNATVRVRTDRQTDTRTDRDKLNLLAATLRWFTAGGAIRIAVWQLSQTWKLRHYDVIDDVI